MAAAKISSILLCCLALLALCNLERAASSPPVPVWPEQFSVQLTILVEQYGSEFKSKGAMYYNYTKKVASKTASYLYS